jgi:hypothetical protein
MAAATLWSVQIKLALTTGNPNYKMSCQPTESLTVSTQKKGTNAGTTALKRAIGNLPTLQESWTHTGCSIMAPEQTHG